MRITGGLTGLIDDDLRGRWPISTRAAFTCLLGPFVAAVAIATTLTDRSLYRAITAEDGPIEWLQFVGFASAAAAAALTGIRLRGAGERLAGTLWLVFAAGCAGGAGEEISWGQRLLGIETPEALAEINNQGEITIHNIGGLRAMVQVGYLVVGLVGVAAPLAVRAARRRGASVPTWLTWVTPPFFLAGGFALVAGYRLVRFTVLPSRRLVVVRYGEVAELGLAFSLATFAVLSLLLARRLDCDVRSPGRTTSRRLPSRVTAGR